MSRKQATFYLKAKCVSCRRKATGWTLDEQPICERVRANGLVGERIKRGLFVPPDNCQKCGVPKRHLDMHHEDYSLPSMVHCICRSCHVKAHHQPGFLTGIAPFDTSINVTSHKRVGSSSPGSGPRHGENHRNLAGRTIIAIDNDPAAAATYAVNFPGVRVECAPVSGLLDQLPDADVIIGGPPCQPFSIAGEMEGEADERDCIPDFIAAVKKKRPRMFLMENVRGLITNTHWAYFARVLNELEALGYVVEWKLLDAVSFGVPQFRERVWVWGIRADLGLKHQWPLPTHAWPPPQPCMFGSELKPGVTVGHALGLTNSKIIPPRQNGCRPVIRVIGGGRHDVEPKTVRDITDEPSTTLTGQCQGHQQPAIQEYRWSDAMLQKHPPASPAPTVQAKYFKGGAEGLLMVDTKQKRTRQPVDEPSGTVAHDDRRHLRQDGIYIRRLTPLECARLQSVPDDFKWPVKITKTAMYRIVGNGIASRMGAVFSEAFRRVDPEARTLIDLFCGGGLGACGWHSRYWSYEGGSK